MKTNLLDIVATGGTSFDCHLISDYDASRPASMQRGKFLGGIDFGEIDAEGQYVGDDDDIIAASKHAFGLAEEILAKVR